MDLLAEYETYLAGLLKMRQINKQIAKAGVIYFALVFGTGFVLGTIRTLWIAPRVGNRTAELIEAPLMLPVTIVAARWIVARLAVPARWPPRLGMGAIALALLLVAEFALLSPLRGVSIQELRRNPRPGVRNSLLRDAWPFRLHAALGWKP